MVLLALEIVLNLSVITIRNLISFKSKITTGRVIPIFFRVLSPKNMLTERTFQKELVPALKAKK